MKTIVVAYDKKFGIGAHNDLLWLRDLPADLKHFKDLTSGHTVIMGRNTYNSIGRPLPNRQNIVVSHTMKPLMDVEVAPSIDDAYARANGPEVYIIGGARVYTEALSSVDEIQATEVDAVFDNASVFFPSIDTNAWQEVSREHHDADEANKYAYDFVRYVRR